MDLVAAASAAEGACWNSVPSPSPRNIYYINNNRYMYMQICQLEDDMGTNDQALPTSKFPPSPRQSCFRSADIWPLLFVLPTSADVCMLHRTDLSSATMVGLPPSFFNILVTSRLREWKCNIELSKLGLQQLGLWQGGWEMELRREVSKRVNIDCWIDH